MRVLVTGGAGYIGSVLVPALLERGYEARVVDTALFGTAHLPEAAEVVVGDILSFDDQWLDGVEAVIHLAGISNDPMAELCPSVNYLVNAAGTAIVAQRAKKAGISRFVFASTCSVYGSTNGDELDEDHPASPCFPYAISKLMGERALFCLADDGFRPIILRKGTVGGWSPRMRYDLVANTMVKTALTQRRIVVHNPALWRPLIDIKDVASAYVRALDAHPSLTGVFNIAYDNFTIGRLADEVAATLRVYAVNVPIEILRRQDLRNYRVSTQRAHDVLDFRATVSMEQSIELMVRHALEGDATDFDNPIYTNVEWMKLKMAEGRMVGAVA
jgi:nucleoside-diphosphate-sugar epimerase